MVFNFFFSFDIFLATFSIPTYFITIFPFQLQYMKMMGVNQLSHFFAWFLECAGFLILTIIVLTLVLKFGNILPISNGFIIFLYLCDVGLNIISFCYLMSSFFDKTYIAGLSGSLIYILSFFPFIIVMSVETNLTLSQKSALVSILWSGFIIYNVRKTSMVIVYN